MKAKQAGADMSHAYAAIVAVTTSSRLYALAFHVWETFCIYQQYCNDFGVGESLPQLLIAQPAQTYASGHLHTKLMHLALDAADLYWSFNACFTLSSGPTMSVQN